MCNNDKLGGYTCSCQRGYTGENCETRKFCFSFSTFSLKLMFNKLKFLLVLPCILNAPCENNGICVNDLTGGYTCTCLNGYIGKHCGTRNMKN